MEEKNNKIINPNIEDIGFIQKPGAGSHSYTVEETQTMSYINKELLKKQIRGEELELKNNNNYKYFLVENGVVFKYDIDSYTFYQLNLETMMWNINQNLATIYYDTYLRFQELLNFKDYYDIDDQLDLNSGRHL